MAGPVFATAGAEHVIFSGTSQAVPVPSGVAANDVILLFVNTVVEGGGVTITPPSGFTNAPSSPIADSVDGSTNYIFWKRATGSDSGSYTCTRSASGYSKGVALRFTGCVTTGSPIDADNGNVVLSGTASAASATSTGPNELGVLMVWSDGDITSFTQPSGFTVAYNGIPAGDNEVIVSTKAYATAGATGSLVGTFGVGGDSVAWLGLLKPPSAANTGQFFAML
jgi:hypothetical protein